VGIAAGAIVAVSLLAAFVLGTLRTVQSPGRRAAGPACSPRPCTELEGWELYVSGITRIPGHLALRVSFRNNTPGSAFEAVSFRHTGPADFVLHYRGLDLRPTAGDACPAWDERRIERGASAGPDPLCFDVPDPEPGRPELRWSPDTGLFGAAGSVPLPAG
jgi:hypothetical protein